MKILPLFLLALGLFAEDAPTVQQLQAKIAALEAQNATLKATLDQTRLEFQYQLQVCSAPDMMAARLKTQQAMEAEKKITPAEK